MLSCKSMCKVSHVVLPRMIAAEYVSQCWCYDSLGPRQHILLTALHSEKLQQGCYSSMVHICCAACQNARSTLTWTQQQSWEQAQIDPELSPVPAGFPSIHQCSKARKAQGLCAYLSAYTLRTKLCRTRRRDSRFHHRFLTRNLARRGTGRVPFQGRMAVTKRGAVSGWGMNDQNGVAFRKMTPLHDNHHLAVRVYQI